MQTRSKKPEVLYYLNSQNKITVVPQPPLPLPPTPPLPLVDNMAAADGHLPPSFTGSGDILAADWLRDVQHYCNYRNFDPERRLTLIKYLLRQGAADWLEGQPDDAVDTLEHFLAAFRARFEPNALTKYKSAQEMFGRRQQPTESAEEFVAAIKKIGRRIAADDELLRYAVINGLRPDVAGHVIRQQPETLADVLQAARVAELTPSAPSAVDRLEEQLRQLNLRLERSTVAAVSPRASPAPYEQRPVTPPLQPRQPTFGRRSGPDRHVAFADSPVYNNQQQRQQRHQQQQQHNNNRCGRCGYLLPHRGGACPALNPRNRCHYCGLGGHFSSVCRSARADQLNQRQY